MTEEKTSSSENKATSESGKDPVQQLDFSEDAKALVKRFVHKVVYY